MVAATEMQPKKKTLSQCHNFDREVNFFLLATRYMWLARINVSGIKLIAPVRLMKSPKNGSRADRNVVKPR